MGQAQRREFNLPSFVELAIGCDCRRYWNIVDDFVVQEAHATGARFVGCPGSWRVGADGDDHPWLPDGQVGSGQASATP